MRCFVVLCSRFRLADSMALEGMAVLVEYSFGVEKTWLLQL
jgi:hypothetical protein